MAWLRFLLLLACFVLCSLRAQAAPEPIVFDFEDGLQGWTLDGSAQRVQTGLLGGSWAIFGDGTAQGRATIWMEVNLADIALIFVEQFFVAGNEDRLAFFLGISLVENIFIGTYDPFEVIEPGNPSLRGYDVSSFTGVGTVGVTWRIESGSNPPDPIIAFIDNITFHPVPEPSTLGLAALGLVALLIARRRRV